MTVMRKTFPVLNKTIQFINYFNILKCNLFDCLFRVGKWVSILIMNLGIYRARAHM